MYQDNAYVRLRHLTENERFTEKKVAIPELLEIVVKLKHGEQSSNSGPNGSTIGGPLVRIDSTTRIPETSSIPQVNIEWQYFPDRKNATVRKRLEASITSKMLPIWSSFVSSTDIQVFVLPFPGMVFQSKETLELSHKISKFG